MRTSLSKPFSAKAKFLVLIMAFLFTLLLTACGSSGSGSGATPTPGDVTPTPDVSASGDQLDRTSRARQTAGAMIGFVQSTNFDGSNTSQDEFNTALTTDGDGNEVIRFSHTDTTGGLGEITVNFQLRGDDAEYHTAMEVAAAGIEFGNTHFDISFTEINDYEELDDGYLWTDIFISNMDFTRVRVGELWLLGGVWLYTPKSAAEDYEIGAFLAANEIISQDITGSHAEVNAVYKGVATGTFLAGKTDNGWAGGGYFDAKATLTATFTSGDGGDTIAGRISDVEITEAYGSASTESYGEFITLESADISSTNGFYEGTTTSSDDHVGFWGGGFFDTGGVEQTDTPETAGGTFSASNVDVAADADASVFVGVFITTRDE